MSAIIGACGQADGRESLIRVFNCSTRTAILRNVDRMVSKVAVRQRDRFRFGANVTIITAARSELA